MKKTLRNILIASSLLFGVSAYSQNENKEFENYLKKSEWKTYEVQEAKKAPSYSCDVDSLMTAEQQYNAYRENSRRKFYEAKERNDSIMTEKEKMDNYKKITKTKFCELQKAKKAPEYSCEPDTFKTENDKFKEYLQTADWKSVNIEESISSPRYD